MKKGTVLVACLMLLAPIVTFAGGYGGGHGGHPPKLAPLDGGLSLLAMAGAAYGAKKYAAKKAKKESSK